MSFSITAALRFIVQSGVAVLNGLVILATSDADLAAGALRVG
jgi:Cu/Ag efflux pump CusA